MTTYYLTKTDINGDAVVSEGCSLQACDYQVTTEIQYHASDINGGDKKPGVTIVNGQVYTYRFNSNVENDLTFSAKLGSDYIDGTDINIRVYWSPKTNQTANVVWNVKTLRACTVDTLLTNTPVSQNVTSASSAIAYQPVMTSDVVVDGSSYVSGNNIEARLSRDINDVNDTLSSDALFLSVEISYTTKFTG